MATTRRHHCKHRGRPCIARTGSALLILSGAAWHATAQEAASAPDAAASATANATASARPATQLTPVTVTGRAANAIASIAGFGDVPLAKSPLQAAIVSTEQLRDSGGIGLTALTRANASVGDAYNADGYWSTFSIRGFATDNRYNFLRDGLPINAETSLPLDNKTRVEVLEGTSGIQSGTSAPGGLVNLVVKRPEGTVRSARLGWREDGTFSAAVDIGQRFGVDEAFGWRLNVGAEHLDPRIRDLVGNRTLVALAGDWRLGADTLLEAEIETSRQSQPSVPGFSLLGSKLPDARDIDPRINLNNQPWSLPVVLAGTTGSLRWQQRLSPDWKLVATAMEQHLRSDDRLAFPYGCSKHDEVAYDRYCSDGTYDLYDFRSDDEQRRTEDLDLHAEGRISTGILTHHVTVGVLNTRFTLRTQPQDDDTYLLGSGNIAGTSIVPPLPAGQAKIANANRTERSTEVYARDRIELTPALGLWLGARYTRLHRESHQFDGVTQSDQTAYDQSFTTPWLAASYALTPDLFAYASWGEGVESTVAPNLGMYDNAGQPLPALKSRQFEIGIKQSLEKFDWGLAWFDINRPQFNDIGATCTGNASGPDGNCLETRLDGHAHHTGVEANARWSVDALTLRASAMWLNASLHDSVSDPSLDGKRPTNVPSQSLRLDAAYALAAVPGLTLRGALAAEGDRMVLPDNSIRIPGWSRLDLGVSYQQKAGATTLTWLLGVDNALDRRAWRESPYQYQHVYLYPLAPRTWRASVQIDL
ncbi:MAG: TonB-dependent siderophore receptor [Proteobacteria bacterium]|nr:TonB-dependent siderophore receptor [Pseudomonadota bacterium]